MSELVIEKYYSFDLGNLFGYDSFTSIKDFKSHFNKELNLIIKDMSREYSNFKIKKIWVESDYIDGDIIERLKILTERDETKHEKSERLANEEAEKIKVEEKNIKEQVKKAYPRLYKQYQKLKEVFE